MATAAAMVAGACSSDDGAAGVTIPATTNGATTAPSTPPTTAPPTTVATTAAPTTAAPMALPLAAPEGEAFYTPPDPLPAGSPGDVIWAREITAPQGARSWLVLYLSESAYGEPVAVSGTVTAPSTPATDRPILAWAHGTTGLGDQCAPSKTFETAGSSEATLAGLALGQGYVFVATDYQGLGTPGVHPFLVGLSEGRSVLDSVRAAQRLEGTGASAASEAVVWGHSQGGQSAAMAGDLAPTYAPDTNVVGAVVGSPAAELPTLLTGATASPAFGFGFMIGAGFQAVYPELDLGAVFTPEGLAGVEEAKTSCVDIVAKYAAEDPSRYVKADPTAAPGWAEVLQENSPGATKTSVPVFVYHGEADELIPVAISRQLLQRYCAVGTTASLKTYPGGTHAGVVPMAFGDITTFAADRFAGTPAPSSC